MVLNSQRSWGDDDDIGGASGAQVDIDNMVVGERYMSYNFQNEYVCHSPPVESSAHECQI